MKIRCNDIAEALEAVAPLSLQESYDNCGWQVGTPEADCRGVLVCVDVTPARVTEAVENGCNMIVSHHPLLFHGLKHITGDTVVERTVMSAISNGIGIYSLHTALDNAPAPWGVSSEMARMLGLKDIRPLDMTTGSGAVGQLPEAAAAGEAIELVKATFGTPVVRCSDLSPRGGAVAPVNTIALCGGSGSFLIDQAIAAGADLYLTSDTSYHKFVDYAPAIILADIGHFESERCTKAIISRIISEKFPNFAVWYSQQESNPITYL